MAFECYLPQRVILAIMVFLAIVNAYTMRISLSVAITKLVIRKNHTKEELGESVCPPSDQDDDWTYTECADYDWSEELQGVILSSFYWGYIITHIPGGMFSDKFGGKWALSFGLLSSATFTLMTPTAIRVGGAPLLIIIRVLMGLGEGLIFPALSCLLSAWVPMRERGKLGALVLGGTQVGTILANSLTGVMMHYFVWDWTFYIFGLMAMVCFTLFVGLCTSDPASHPYIKDEEKDYLMQELGVISRRTDLPPTPWRDIFTNVPMIALIIAQIGYDWGYFTMITDLPKYMADVMQFSIKRTGAFSSLPAFMMWIVSLFSGFLSDFLISRDILGVTNARKLFTSIAAFGPAPFIVLASHAGCDRTLAVVHFTIAMGLMGTYYAGMKLNPMDFSPNYSGTLMAITSCFGSFTGIVVPYLVGVMTPNATLLEWRRVFWLTFGVLCSTCVVYVIWGSGEVQPFNDPKPPDVNEDQKTEN